MTGASEPAYPLNELHEEIDYLLGGWGGLNKREYFAACAMQGLLANKYLGKTEQLEKQAVKHADRLIEALNKEQG